MDARLRQLNAIAYSQRDEVFVDCVWVAFFIALAAWMYALFLSFKPQQTLHSFLRSLSAAQFSIGHPLHQIPTPCARNSHGPSPR